jgi:hypothetical protein
MYETPASFNDSAWRSRPARAPLYPADNLAGYSYHTGARLRPLQPGETCPVLFRDLGPLAMQRFLRGELRRLAGPLSPITYMRTEAYIEPYTDYEQIGRLIFLRPLELHPWHSGLPAIYVARAGRMAEAATIGFVPGEVGLARASWLAGEARDTRELRDILGGRRHDEAMAETIHRLEALTTDLEQTEKLAAPLRHWLQSADRGKRERAREAMERVRITENDLCAAWHHLPRSRRDWVLEALRQLGPAFPPPPP